MVILYLLFVLITVILARALMFTPKAEPEREIEPVEFDREECVRNLSALVRCRTVSYADSNQRG